MESLYSSGHQEPRKAERVTSSSLLATTQWLQIISVTILCVYMIREIFHCLLFLYVYYFHFLCVMQKHFIGIILPYHIIMLYNYLLILRKSKLMLKPPINFYYIANEIYVSYSKLLQLNSQVEIIEKGFLAYVPINAK